MKKGEKVLWDLIPHPTSSEAINRAMYSEGHGSEIPTEIQKANNEDEFNRLLTDDFLETILQCNNCVLGVYWCLFVFLSYILFITCLLSMKIIVM